MYITGRKANFPRVTHTQFDLFRRTFGETRVVLSLAYSLYTAASIFLVQLQANPSDQQVWQRLKFCTQALDRVRVSAPVLNTPLESLAGQIARLGGEENTSHVSKPDVQGGRSDVVGLDSSRHVPDEEAVDEALWRELVDLGFPEIEVDPNIFDMLTNMEPMSANLRQLDDLQ